MEKAGCEHVKTLAQAEAAFSIDDTKDPSAEASLIGGKNFTDIWENGDRGMAHEIIKKSEKDTHCWGLVLKCYELRTRQHKMLNVNVLHPRSIIPLRIMNLG